VIPEQPLLSPNRRSPCQPEILTLGFAQQWAMLVLTQENSTSVPADVAAIVSLAYEAALDEEVRPRLIDEIKTLISADSVIWLATDGGDPDRSNALFYNGLDSSTMAEYARLGWSSPMVPGMLRASPCQPLTPGMLIAERDLERSTFYQEWVRPNKIGAAMLTLLAPMSGPTVIMTAMREKSTRETDFNHDSSLSRYRDLLPYLGRAFLFTERFRRAWPRPTEGAGVALDALAVPIFCLNARFQPVWMNNAAERILHQNDGLSWSPAGGLSAASVHETARLHAALLAARQAQGGSVKLWRPSGEAALSVIAIPCRSRAQSFQAVGAQSQPGNVLAFVFGYESKLAGAEHALHVRLRTLYGLTATEALMCIQVAHGAGIPAIAHAARLQTCTIRTHVKHAFAKIGVHTQAELTRLITRIGLIEP